MKKRISALCAGVLVLGMAGTAQATLIDRGDGLIYDNVLDVTWLQDANYAKTSGHDSDGLMTWDNAVAWAAGLSYGGYEDWRLPGVVPTGGSYSFSNNGTTTGGYGATGSGYNTATPLGGWGPAGDTDGIWSEMGWMWYHNLGNLGYCTPNGSSSSTSCDEQTGWGLIFTGLFDTSLQSYVYWSGTEYAPNTVYAWSFGTDGGSQYDRNKDREFYAWAVRSGDVAGVPEPSTILLMGLGLAGIGYRRRRLKKA